MKLFNLKLEDLSEKTTPLPNMTVENLESAMKGLFPAMATFTMNKDNFKVPPAFLHARQVGAELNCAILRSPEGSALIINPKYIVQDQETIVPNVDYNVSYRKEDGTLQAFMASRSINILAMFDVYKRGALNEETKEYAPGTFTRKSIATTDDEAIWFQHICDISQGKLLTRFEKTDVVIDEIDGAQMEIQDINEIADEFNTLDDEVINKDEEVKVND